MKITEIVKLLESPVKDDNNRAIDYLKLVANKFSGFDFINFNWKKNDKQNILNTSIKE